MLHENNGVLAITNEVDEVKGKAASLMLWQCDMKDLAFFCCFHHCGAKGFGNIRMSLLGALM